jgi:hypothetical protein
MARTTKSQLLWLLEAVKTLPRIVCFLLECVVAGLFLSLYFNILAPQAQAPFYAHWVILGVILATLIVAAKTHRFRFLFTSESNRFHLKTAAVLLTSIVLYYSIEKWQGKRMWARMQREIAASGETPGITKPVAVPDDQDMAKAPIFLPWTKLTETPDHQIVWLDEPGRRRIEALFLPTMARQFDGSQLDAAWWHGRQVDYSQLIIALQGEIRPHSPAAHIKTPSDILALLEPRRAGLEEIRQASLRPHAFFTTFEHSKNLQKLAEVFVFRADAELKAGKTDEALEDILCALRLANHEIKYVGVAMFRSHNGAQIFIDALQPVWEGVCAHQWNDRQLTALIQQIDTMHFLPGAKNQAHDFAWLNMDLVNQLVPVAPLPLKPSWLGIPDQSPIRWIRMIYPSGWSYQDQVIIHDWLRNYEKTIDASQDRVPPELISQPPAINPQDPFFLIFMMPKLKEIRAGITWWPAIAQTALDLGKTACALECCRLAEGGYPEKLESIAPRYIGSLPHDIINGQPLHYQRQAAERFTLYSVGFNQKDDQGKIDEHSFGQTTRIDFDQGDWVWGFPANTVQTTNR